MPRSVARPVVRKRAPSTTRAFLFSDLRDYTTFVERHGNQAAARLLKDYRTLVRKEIARHAGAEIKTEGDSFYVVFDSASSALECAVALLRRAGARGEDDVPLRVGVGLHAGDTVRYDDQFVGSAVNIASRLASQAGAGELLVSDTFRGLVRTSTSHGFSDRGELKLKGVAEPVRAWTVEWDDVAHAPSSAEADIPRAPSRPPAAPALGQIVCPVVVGRETERARAVQLLDAAREGRGQTLLVGGEAGVGKSAYVRDAVAAATDRGFRVLYGATLESDRGLAYAPFLAAVRSGFRGLERDRLGCVLAQAAPDLAELFPELGRPRRATEGGEIDQHRLGLAFQGLFATFAREGPVLLVVEDLHWADEASLGLFQSLSREVRDTRTLLLATYRSDEMHRRHPFLRVLAGMQRERLLSEVNLRRLEREQTRELIRATLAQSHPTVRVSDEFLEAIDARSEGNPYFTEELLKALVESGGLYYRPETGWDRKPIDQLQIPGSIREAVRGHAERLSEDARTTLAVAAVFGLQFDFDALASARGIDEGALEEHLREFIEAQLVVERGGDDEGYAFRHALTKEVVYDDLLVRERKRLHRAVADALETVTTTEPSLLAHHLLAAGEPQRAVPHLLAAADRAHAAGAPREATAHYARAIEIGLPDDRLAAVLERQVEAYLFFDVTLMIKTAEEALALYREIDDPRGRSRMLLLMSLGHSLQGRHAQAERLAQEAIDVLAGEEGPELGRALADRARLLMMRMAMAESITVADRALEIGERFSDAPTLANALITRGSAMKGQEGIALLRRGLDIALRRGLTGPAHRAYNNLGIALNFAGASLTERLALIEEGLTFSRRHGAEADAIAYLLAQKCILELSSGAWDAALETGRGVSEASSVAAQPMFARAWVVAAREGPAAALPLYRELAARATGMPANAEIVTRIVLADGYGGAGLLDEARAELARLGELAASHPRGAGELLTPRSALAGQFLPQLLSAALRTGDIAWLDEASAEIRDGAPQAEAQRSTIAAARALLAGDAEGCADAVVRAIELHAQRGVGAHTHGFAVTCLQEARRRGLALGTEWRSLAALTRAFAEQAGARWWLSVLSEAGLEVT